MIFNHELETGEITQAMENEGYSSLEPAISPEKLKNLCENDPILIQCYESMISYCNRYAHDVFNMMYEQKIIEEMNKNKEDTTEAYEELKVIDRNRHNLHEALMDSINLLSRELAKREIDNTWMHEVVSGGRATYGIFALLTFYKLYGKVDKSS